MESVTKAYYQVVINKERANLFTVNLQRLDSVINQTKALNKSGFSENIDVTRLEVQYNNLLTDQQNFENMNELSKVLLKFQMGMPLEQPLSVSDNISSIQLDSSSATGQFDYTQRIEYSLLKTQESLMMLDLKRIRYSRLPNLAAFGKYGLNRQDVSFGNLFTNAWFSYSMVGLSLNVPILDLRSQYQAQQSKLNLKKTQNSITNLKNAIGADVQSQRLTYLNKLKAMQNQKRNMELAQEVARVTKIKYQEGVGSNLEVVNAESDLKQAQINYYQALYDALVSKIDYQKATGTLYNGQ
jgi:outer membrane protein TolC